jgi:hypothetical protein
MVAMTARSLVCGLAAGALLVAPGGIALAQSAAPKAAPALVGTTVLGAEAPFVDALVAGKPVRLRLDFAAHAPIILTPAAAGRLGLASDVRPATDGKKAEKPSRGVIVSRVGRQTVRVPYSREQVEIGGVARAIQVATPEGYAVTGKDGAGRDGAGADGSILPSALPVAVVRLQQRPPGPGDVETTWQVLDDGAFDGLEFRAMAGPNTIRVGLAPSRPQTVGTASTAGALAELNGGRLTGPVSPVMVVYGVSRPARLLQLDKPWTGAGVAVTRLMMRLHDWEGKDPVPMDGDLDAQVIQVNARRNAQRGIRLMKLGADALGRCAGFEWRRAGNLLVLQCPAVQP